MVKGFFKMPPTDNTTNGQKLVDCPCNGANPTVISNWFSLLEEIKTKFRILSPCQIWSGDETGIQNIPKEVKVLGVKKIRTFQQVGSKGKLQQF